MILVKPEMFRSNVERKRQPATINHQIKLREDPIFEMERKTTNAQMNVEDHSTDNLIRQ